VGTTRTQSIEVVNRGGDIYPINSLAVSGDNRDEFVSDFYGPITLNPSEAVRLNITFQPGASQKYSDYIKTSPAVDVNKKRAAIKLPVIKESEVYGEGHGFKGYLRAMDARDAGNYRIAHSHIDQLMITDSTGYLADDALYLKGYIQLMDEQNYAAAQKTMQQLRRTYPDTSYYDTALYSEALALEALGRICYA